MEQLLIIILLALLLAFCIGLSDQVDKDLDGPAPAIGKVFPSSQPNSFDFSSETSILFADGPAGAIGGLILFTYA
jgi:hypothetical protein